MPIVMGGENFYRTVEVCRMAGISRNTLFRWLKVGIISEPERRDWRGWRLFSESQLESARERTGEAVGADAKRDRVGP